MPPSTTAGPFPSSSTAITDREDALIVADGGTLNTSAEIWSAIGYNDTARLVVETGGELTFGQHMWVGLTPNSYGTVELNGGTINVGQMTGLGWDGATGFLYLNDRSR